MERRGIRLGFLNEKSLCLSKRGKKLKLKLKTTHHDASPASDQQLNAGTFPVPRAQGYDAASSSHTAQQQQQFHCCCCAA
jgi:hypothetical protein